MRLSAILENVAKTLADVKLCGKKSDPKLAELDRGVLTVALLVAALDGTILPEECAAFELLAKKCRGGSTKNARAVLDKALQKTGYLMAMAQVGVYTEKERIAAFAQMATEALPRGFVEGSLADLRRAFALWVAMAVSDGSFSDVERKALATLEDLYADLRLSREQKATKNACAMSPCLKSLCVDKKATLLEPQFIEKAERIVRDLTSASKGPKAAEALEALVSTVDVVGPDGELLSISSAKIGIN